MSDIILSSALVNKGNVIFKKGDYEKAREFFREALQNDSSCIEALYNLGKFINVAFILQYFYPESVVWSCCYVFRKYDKCSDKIHSYYINHKPECKGKQQLILNTSHEVSNEAFWCTFLSNAHKQ